MDLELGMLDSAVLLRLSFVTVVLKICANSDFGVCYSSQTLAVLPTVAAFWSLARGCVGSRLLA